MHVGKRRVQVGGVVAVGALAATLLTGAGAGAGEPPEPPEPPPFPISFSISPEHPPPNTDFQVAGTCGFEDVEGFRLPGDTVRVALTDRRFNPKDQEEAEQAFENSLVPVATDEVDPDDFSWGVTMTVPANIPPQQILFVTIGCTFIFDPPGTDEPEVRFQTLQGPPEIFTSGEFSVGFPEQPPPTGPGSTATTAPPAGGAGAPTPPTPAPPPAPASVPVEAETPPALTG